MSGRHRLTRFMADRRPVVRAVRAWRALLPDWTPSLGDLHELESRPPEHAAAVRVLTQGWAGNDARWDVLLALLEWERQAERERRAAADELTRLGQEMGKMECTCGSCQDIGCDVCRCHQRPDNVISMDEEFERLRDDSEITVETPMPGMKVLQRRDLALEEISSKTKPPQRLTLVPKEGTPKVFTVRTLASVREEMERDG